MAGFRVLFDFFFFITIPYLINCSRIEDVLRQESDIDNVAHGKTNPVHTFNETGFRQNSQFSDIRSTLLDLAGMWNYGIAGGMVSIDCLRCLCLKQSNCLPVGCWMYQGTLGCGYFFLSHAFWIDCGYLGKDWRSCSNNLACSSQCVQNYMKRYAEKFSCFLKCEGYSRELNGGPNGCNNPRTVAFWDAVQEQPGCKGVE